MATPIRVGWTDAQVSSFLEARKRGAHLAEDYRDDSLLMLGVDLVNFPKFPKSVAEGVTFPKAQLDVRQELGVDSGAELADYSGA
jgi:hypothetical protein